MHARAGTTAANQHPQAAPAAAAGLGETDHLLRAMTAVLARQRPASAAEALRVLRHGYPDIPLAMRIAALCSGAK